MAVFFHNTSRRAGIFTSILHHIFPGLHIQHGMQASTTQLGAVSLSVAALCLISLNHSYYTAWQLKLKVGRVHRVDVLFVSKASEVLYCKSHLGRQVGCSDVIGTAGSSLAWLAGGGGREGAACHGRRSS